MSIIDYRATKAIFSPAYDFIRSYGIGARVCIVGSYDFLYPTVVRLFIADLPRTAQIMLDTVGTVEKTAKSMARHLHVQYKEFPVEWREYGLEAASIRNQKLVKCDLCCLIAFLSGGRSKRANKIIDYAMEEKIPVFFF
jgi:hypothetical protein